jgi:hypothetical protein
MRRVIWILPVLLLAAMIGGPAYARTASHNAATSATATSTARQQPAHAAKTTALPGAKKAGHPVARTAHQGRARVTSHRARAARRSATTPQRQYEARLAKYYGRLAKHYQSLAARYGRMARHEAQLAKGGSHAQARSHRQGRSAPALKARLRAH